MMPLGRDWLDSSKTLFGLHQVAVDLRYLQGSGDGSSAITSAGRFCEWCAAVKEVVGADLTISRIHSCAAGRLRGFGADEELGASGSIWEHAWEGMDGVWEHTRMPRGKRPGAAFSSHLEIAECR